jgi:hypothetical protein
MQRMLDQAAPYMAGQGMSIEDIFGMIEQQTGVDVQAVIGALGDTWAFYLSDATGGGTLLSGVLVVKLNDPGEMQQTITQLSGMFNGAIGGQIDTEAFTVQLSQFDHGGTHFTQLRAPGLPVPIEPTIAISGEWLVAGLSAQAAAGAVRQIEQGGPGLAQNASFSADKVAFTKATDLMFIDAARTIRDGYPAMGLLSSALCNAVRSPHTARDPGLILPPYGELVQGARPLVATSFWDGDDYVTQWTGDRSSLVNAAAVLGVGDLGSFIGGAMLGAGITGGIMKEQMQRGQWEMDFEEDEPGF